MSTDTKLTTVADFETELIGRGWNFRWDAQSGRFIGVRDRPFVDLTCGGVITDGFSDISARDLIGRAARVEELLDQDDQFPFS